MAEGGVVLSQPGTRILAESASFDGTRLVLVGAEVLDGDDRVYAQRLEVTLSSGAVVASGVRFLWRDTPVEAERVEMLGDALALRGVRLEPGLRASRATRVDDGWRIQAGIASAGPLPLAWLEGEVSEHRRKSGLLPPSLGFRSDGGAEATAAAFGTLGPSADVAAGAFGDHLGTLGVQSRFRHVGGDLRLAATLLEEGRSSQDMALIGAGAVDPRELPSLRYDLDWLSRPTLAERFRLHPWQSQRLGRRLGAPGRSAVALGIRSWSASADVGSTVWQPAGAVARGGPQGLATAAAAGMTFQVAQLVRVNLELDAASLPANGSDAGQVEFAAVHFGADLPVTLGRFLRIRAHADADATTTSYDQPDSSGTREISGLHTLQSSTSVRLDTLLARHGDVPHTLELEAGAYARAGSNLHSSGLAPVPPLPFDHPVPRYALALRIGQRLPTAQVRLDMGWQELQTEEGTLLRAGVRARWSTLFAQTSKSRGPDAGWEYATGLLLEPGRARLRVGAARRTGLSRWSHHPAQPLGPSLRSSATEIGVGHGSFAGFDTPLWPGSVVYVGADAFLPFRAATPAPEVGAWLALGDSDGMRLELRAVRRRDPQAFDALATASFVGF